MVRPEEVSRYEYRLDAEDRIEAVSESWSTFARDNETPEMVRPGILGRSIWEFIAGAETRDIYRAAFERARREGGSLILPFRCDAPDCRRWMELTIRSPDRKTLELTSVLLREERREAPTLLSETAPPSHEQITMCSWCKRVLTDDDRWLEVEAAVGELDLFGEKGPPSITHGICPECKSEMLAAVVG